MKEENGTTTKTTYSINFSKGMKMWVKERLDRLDDTEVVEECIMDNYFVIKSSYHWDDLRKHFAGVATVGVRKSD